MNKMNYREILGEARAVHFAMHRGAITYEKAVELTKPLLGILNVKATEIAKRYKIRPRLLKFQDLGRTI